MNPLISLIAKVLSDVINDWMRSLGLRKQGATEQRERDQKDAITKVNRAIKAGDAVEPDSTHGVRNSDFRDQ